MQGKEYLIVFILHDARMKAKLKNHPGRCSE